MPIWKWYNNKLEELGNTNSRFVTAIFTIPVLAICSIIVIFGLVCRLPISIFIGLRIIRKEK